MAGRWIVIACTTVVTKDCAVSPLLFCFCNMLTLPPAEVGYINNDTDVFDDGTAEDYGITFMEDTAEADRARQRSYDQRR